MFSSYKQYLKYNNKKNMTGGGLESTGNGFINSVAKIPYKGEINKIPKSVYIPVGLRLDNSLVKGAGLGIFADQDYPSGHDFGAYKGRWLTPEEYNEKDKDLLYVWEVNDYRGNKHRAKGKKFEPSTTIGYWDGECKKDSNYMRYINHPRTAQEENILAKQVGPYVHYFSSRPIKDGEELFVNYGPSYSKLLIGTETPI